MPYCLDSFEKKKNNNNKKISSRDFLLFLRKAISDLGKLKF